MLNRFLGNSHAGEKGSLYITTALVKNRVKTCMTSPPIFLRKETSLEGVREAFFWHFFAAAQQEKTRDKIGVKHTAWALLRGDADANPVDFDGQMTGLKPATCCASSVKICSDHGKHGKFVAVHASHQPLTVRGLLSGPNPGFSGKLFAPSEGSKNGGPAFFAEFFRERDVSKGRGLDGHHS